MVRKDCTGPLSKAALFLYVVARGRTASRLRFARPAPRARSAKPDPFALSLSKGRSCFRAGGTAERCFENPVAIPGQTGPWGVRLIVGQRLSRNGPCYTNLVLQQHSPREGSIRC